MTPPVAVIDTGVWDSPLVAGKLTGCTSDSQIAQASAEPSALVSPYAVPVRVAIPHVRSASRYFELRRPMLCIALHEDDQWVCECGPLKLWGHGSSQESAIADLMDDFAISYDGLANEPDDALSADAQLLKYRLRDLVARVRSDSRIEIASSSSPVAQPLDRIACVSLGAER